MKSLRTFKALYLLVGAWQGLCAGCSVTPARTGFLSDYSRLQPEGSDLRFVDVDRLAGYTEFIIEPITVHFHDAASGSKVAPATLRQLSNYMHRAIVSALADRYSIVAHAGPGIGRVRVALTDVQSNPSVLGILPLSRTTRSGLGGASMEGEVVDSLTAEQIAAVIQMQQEESFSLNGTSEWESTMAVMDGWAKRFRQRLDEAHR